MNNKQTIGKRIAAARQEVGMNQSELAARLGLVPQSVQAWESGRAAPGIDKISRIADILGVQTEFLISGRETPASGGLDAIPLLSWQIDPLSVGAGTPRPKPAEEGRYVVKPTNCSDKAYALMVRGRSMAPRCAEGDIIVVDPEPVPKSGDLIVALLPGDEEPTFKQLIFEDGKRFLAALNPMWTPQIQELPKKSLILGVVKAIVVEL